MNKLFRGVLLSISLCWCVVTWAAIACADVNVTNAGQGSIVVQNGKIEVNTTIQNYTIAHNKLDGEAVAEMVTQEVRREQQITTDAVNRIAERIEKRLGQFEQALDRLRQLHQGQEEVAERLKQLAASNAKDRELLLRAGRDIQHEISVFRLEIRRLLLDDQNDQARKRMQQVEAWRDQWKHYSSSVSAALEQRRRRQMAGYFVGVAAGLLVTTGIVFTLLAMDSNRVADEHCRGDICTAEGVQAINSYNDRARMAGLSYGLGLGAAVNAGLLVYGPQRSLPIMPSSLVGANLVVRGTF